MAVGTVPIFVDTPRSPGVRISTANTNTDGATGTYGTLFTTGADGAKFAGIRWQAEVNTTAGAIRIFFQDAGAGNAEMVKEWVVPATTFVAGVTPYASDDWFPPGGIVLSGGTVVKCSTHIGEAFGVFLQSGGDF